MRTEIKIGVAAAAFIALVAVLYFVLLADWDSGEKKPPPVSDAGKQGAPKEQVDSQPPPRIPVERTSPPASRTPGDLIASTEPPANPQGVTPRISVEETTRPPVTGTSSEPARPVLVKTTPEGPSAVAAPAKPVDTSGGTLRLPEAGTPVVRLEPVVVVEPAVEGQPVPAAASQERIYKVQQGDLGFWTISKKVYGSSEYWTVIRDANPGLDSKALRAGQIVKIPPLPRKVATASAAPKVLAAGERVYVVQRGDNGFWGIAEKVYGDGTLWGLIAKANPGVNSLSLRPGQKLVIPAKTATVATTGQTGSTGGVVTVGGTKKYVVRRGDAGLWAVAANVYGNGNYWRLIAAANPGVDSNRLQPGQELVIPELTQETIGKYGAPSSSGRTTTRPAGAADDIPGRPVRPIFD